MTIDDIDPETGLLDVFALLPRAGDSVMIVNCGKYYEVQQHSWVQGDMPPLHLTDTDLDRLRLGSIIWH